MLRWGAGTLEQALHDDVLAVSVLEGHGVIPAAYAESTNILDGCVISERCSCWQFSEEASLLVALQEIQDSGGEPHFFVKSGTWVFGLSSHLWWIVDCGITGAGEDRLHPWFYWHSSSHYRRHQWLNRKSWIKNGWGLMKTQISTMFFAGDVSVAVDPNPSLFHA